jgi:UDP-N-acetylglucosamine acyltransferase
MTTRISPLSHVDPGAEIGEGVEIGPFCHVGPHVVIGDGCRLHAHVTILGPTTIGQSNCFFPGAVIGGDPQDAVYGGSPTRLEIGDENVFREGVTVHRGAEKEDHVTRVGNRNMLMVNSHVGHNCHVHSRVLLANGCLLAGHVHVHDGAVLSGNSVVHQFATIGMLSFVAGMGRVAVDVPPFMMLVGCDDSSIKTVNTVGMRRAGMSAQSIELIKRAHRLLFREVKPLDEVRDIFAREFDGIIPFELSTLLSALEKQRRGRMGRAREAARAQTAAPETNSQRRAA